MIHLVVVKNGKKKVAVLRRDESAVSAIYREEVYLRRMK
ncbi:hypothetical protein LINPERHAP1_LOCUS19779 [Linum perenne]